MSQPIEGQPDLASTYAAAVAALDRGELAAAREALDRVVADEPRHVEALLRLGGLDHAEGRHAEAAERFRRATELRPEDYRGWANLATAMRMLGQEGEARELYLHAIGLDPGQARPHLLLGRMLATDLDDPAAAEPHLRRGLELAPDQARDYPALSDVLLRQGRVAEALATFCAGIERGGGDREIAIRLLELATYEEGLPVDQVAAVHRWVGRELCRGVPQFVHRPSAEAAERRLRIGYMSPDLRRHSVSYFIAPVLARHDRREVEVRAYASVAHPDAVTEALRARVDYWVDAHGMPDAELARRIRLDGIDILVDLAGYTRGGRPAVLATKPAPIQASWIGYANATGIPTIDYWIVDEITDPPGSETPLGERPARLAPCFLCFEPPGWAPQVAPAPLLRRHGPTFGSFNNSRKIIAPLIALWARLLRAVPGARLLLKGRGLGEAEGDARLRAAFGAEGIDPERLELRDWLDSPEAHLRAYGDVDIALDTSPYNGTTTTCEALWMGVPVVALLGDRHASRVSASLLQAVGLPELVARDRDHYVAIAARLAADPAALAARRAGLREQVRASSLCDAPRFTRGLEAAYRAMWRDYCQGAPPAAAA